MSSSRYSKEKNNAEIVAIKISGESVLLLRKYMKFLRQLGLSQKEVSQGTVINDVLRYGLRRFDTSPEWRSIVEKIDRGSNEATAYESEVK